MNFRTAAILTALGAVGATTAAVLLRNRSESLRLVTAAAAFGLPWVVRAAVHKPVCSFLFIADTHGSAQANRSLVDWLLYEEDITAVLHAGDIADTAALFSPWWDTAFARVLNRWPVYAAEGNHDCDTPETSAEFAERFGILPRRVACGPVEIYLMPWNIDRGDVDWLWNAVRTSHATWRILVVHRPVWSVRTDDSALRGRLLPILPYIHLVLAGHEHVSSDTTRVVGGAPVRQIVDISGPKKYSCLAGTEAYCTPDQTAFWRIDVFDDKIQLSRRIVP